MDCSYLLSVLWKIYGGLAINYSLSALQPAPIYSLSRTFYHLKSSFLDWQSILFLFNWRLYLKNVANWQLKYQHLLTWCPIWMRIRCKIKFKIRLQNEFLVMNLATNFLRDKSNPKRIYIFSSGRLATVTRLLEELYTLKWNCKKNMEQAIRSVKKEKNKTCSKNYICSIFQRSSNEFSQI